MKRVWHTSAKFLTGFFVAAMVAMPQATVSARPGVINYVEGQASLDGQPLPSKIGRDSILNANQSLATTAGKAELLLTPGVFLRLGENTEVRMISPSLTHTQVELIKGEAMIEVAQLFSGNDIEVVDHGGSITLQKAGIYKFTADEPPSVSVIEGKAEVAFGDRKVGLKKGREVVLSAMLDTKHFNTKKEDDLYAWSNLRSEYDAGASYSAAKAYTSSGGYGSSYGGGYGYNGYGYGGLGYGFAGYNPGWFWNSGWNSYAWFPGEYAYSPFGWGFFSPAYIGYAPVVYAPVYGGTGRPSRSAAVPVNPNTGANLPRGPRLSVPGASAGTTTTAAAFRNTRVGVNPAAQSSYSGGATHISSAPRGPAMSSGGSSGGGAMRTAPASPSFGGASGGSRGGGGGPHR